MWKFHWTLIIILVIFIFSLNFEKEPISKRHTFKPTCMYECRSLFHHSLQGTTLLWHFSLVSMIYRREKFQEQDYLFWKGYNLKLDSYIQAAPIFLHHIQLFHFKQGRLHIIVFFISLLVCMFIIFKILLNINT